MEVLIITYVPEEKAERFRDLLLSHTLNRIGKYTNCVSYSPAIGCFTADKTAEPFIGNAGESNFVKEVRFEFKCNMTHQQEILNHIKVIHPYEEPAIYCIPLMS